MSRAIVCLIDGFEEIEAVSILDILRRAAIETECVSLSTQRIVAGKHQVPLVADTPFHDALEGEALIVPGGTTAVAHHGGLRALTRRFHSEGKLLAAICAAPVLFGELGLLQGRCATCYPGLEHALKGATLDGAGVVVDGNIITAKGPAFALEFALSIVEKLLDSECAQNIAHALLCP